MSRKAVQQQKVRKWVPLVLILIGAFLVRVWWLGLVPPGISHDELEYVINAKAVYLIGSDITGTWNPWSLSPKTIGNPTAELPAVLTAPIIGPLTLSLFTARLPYVLNSQLLITVVYLLANEWFDRKIAIVTAMLMIFNPWSFHISRTSYEAPLALSFYLLGMWLYIKLKGWKSWWALPIWGVAFFCYHGTKLIFLPLIFIAVLIRGQHHKETSWRRYGLVVVAIVLFAVYLVSFQNQSAVHRGDELLPMAMDSFKAAVDFQRRTSLDFVFETVMINKVTEMMKTFVAQYLGAFSVGELFIRGEIGTFSVWNFGQFYYLDLLLLVIGLMSLWQYPKGKWPVLLLVAIAPIPAALHVENKTYVLRSILMFPMLLLLMAIGARVVIERVLSFRWGKIILAGAVMIYAVQAVSYFYIYFFRYPVYAGEWFDFSERIVSEYSWRVLQQHQVYVLTRQPDLVFEQFLFYSNAYNNSGMAKQLTAKLQSGKYEYESVKVTNNCDVIDWSQTVIVQQDFECESAPVVEMLENKAMVKDPVDSGTIFWIANDKLCAGEDLHSYPSATSRRAYDLKKMTDGEFCGQWVSAYLK